MARGQASAIRWTKEITNAQVLRLIREESDVRKALLIFDSATAEYPSGFRHDAATFAIMSARLAAAGLLPTAFSVLARVPAELGHPPPESAFAALIRAHGRARRPLDALRIFHDAPRLLLLRPSNRSYTALLAVLIAHNRLDLASRLFAGMREAGVPPSVASYNVLLKAHCTDAGSGADVDRALRVFRRMPDRGCPPDSCSYNTEAANYLDEMVLSGITPNRVTWNLHVRINNTVVVGLCAAGDSGRALRVHQSMKSRGISTEPETFSRLVDCYSKKAGVHKAARVVSEMLLEGCVPTRETWGVVIGGYWERRQVREAAEVFLDGLLVVV
ncbi:hypothetical protein OPV22_031446 [Ensete ventricosum]|uniref:Pentacotripeptide-repeat region of PRORP domain-containing protein n=1 Tax=Ensete ventricosum TaxID=4639 RepID=A0AAV8PTK5_ENSVE|nr:hypothetical protein OPV22_031443 [Ensete ventricosum]KAJ8458520.1 hypothetical protein OPV22_031446 [Ensete ventricosum]